jgi:ABC-2 type transport system permease protein
LRRCRRPAVFAAADFFGLLWYFAGIYAIYFPNTTLTQIFAYLPFSSPVLALITLAKGVSLAAYTKILLSLLVLLFSALLLLRLAGRWYKNSILKF